VTIGYILPVSGCFTKEKFIAGRTLAEIEQILGFHAGRLSTGMAVVASMKPTRNAPIRARSVLQRSNSSA
jgi:hypothetical protein